MRKKNIVLITLALIFISGVYAWEGAAATAPDGELPSTGRYIATNSFPRNTVVDIVNIETNRSTRVIVANSLNSPGLIAVVSREAAELIGMRPGSISRIRMTQPSDPIAYLRFTEGLAAGIPDFDSGNVITEENITDDIPAPPSERTETLPPISPNGSVPGYLLESEWGGRRTGIIDLPEYFVSGDPPYSALFDESEEAAEYTPEEVPVEVAAENIPEEVPVEVIAKNIPEEVPVEVAAEYIPEEVIVEEVAEYIPVEEPVEEVAEYIPEEVPVEVAAENIPEEVVVEEVAEYIPEEVPVEVAEFIPEEVIVEEVAEFIPEEAAIVPASEVAQYNIVPAQERPPSPSGTIYGIDPADIIPGISRVIPKQEPAAERPDTALSILMYEVEPIRQPSAAVIHETVPVITMKEVETVTPIIAAPEAQRIISFSSISELNRGAYYVQIAAHESAESAEKAVGMIDRNYGPVVYNDGGNMYRILLGPLNQGESAAILQRFKSIGYRDAFVRHIR